MKIEKRQQAGSAFMRFKHITKENVSVYKCTRERIDPRNGKNVCTLCDIIYDVVDY